MIEGNFNINKTFNRHLTGLEVGVSNKLDNEGNWLLPKSLFNLGLYKLDNEETTPFSYKSKS